MIRHSLIQVAAIAAMVFASAAVFAQESTPPFSAAEREAIYTASIEKRAADILAQLALTDPARSNAVRSAIVAQYRALRARDEAMDTMLRALSKDAPGSETNRAELLPILSRQLHHQFLARLSSHLTPEQLEVVKDRMTYNKVQVTYAAYCSIVPDLSEADKAKILTALKEAREEAMDGGSADEKSAIFQKHKDHLNAYLATRGHDVAKAIKAWEAKQAEAKAAASPR
jgi:hypothetical protein